MKKRNTLLFVGIVVISIVWGLVYWYYVVPVIDPQ